MSDEQNKAQTPPTAPASSQTPPAGSPSATNQAAVPPPNQYIPGEKKKGIAEFFRIVKERRLLRKDLKAKGIKSRKDFKIIAESLGLVLWKSFPFFLWWHHAWTALAAGFGLKMIVAAAATALAGVFLISTVTEEKGSFTINLTGDMLNAGFVLSESESFDRYQSRLFSEKLKAVNNITIDDIDPNVDKIDGPHNGDNYVAYTFYIKNDGEKPSTYTWEVRMKSEMLGVTKAAWIMVFEDGRQMTYTRATDGEPPEAEELFGFDEPLPFSDVAYDPAQYYFSDESGERRYGIKATPYVNENTVAQGLIEDVAPGEYHKYTVVIWLEGYDPDCVDEIFGGFAKFEMCFEYVGEDEDREGLFGGIFRTEYDEYGMNTESTSTSAPDATVPSENEAESQE